MVPQMMSQKLKFKKNISCSRGVMDSTMVFGTISSGSNPDGSTKYCNENYWLKQRKALEQKTCLHSMFFLNI